LQYKTNPYKNRSWFKSVDKRVRFLKPNTFVNKNLGKILLFISLKKRTKYYGCKISFFYFSKKHFFIFEKKKGNESIICSFAKKNINLSDFGKYKNENVNKRM